MFIGIFATKKEPQQKGIFKIFFVVVPVSLQPLM